MAQVGGPVVGLVIDPNSRLRPVLGVPGAASLGDPIAIDGDLQVAAIAPHQDYVIAWRGDAREFTIVRNPLTSPVASQMDGLAGASSVVVSPSGSAALVLFATQSVQVVTGLPDAPALAWQADLTSFGTMPSAFTVSDDGAAVLVGFSGSDRTSIYLITPDAGPRVVASAAQLGGMAFAAHKRDALYTDSGSSQAFIVHDLTGAAVSSVLADSSSGATGFAGIASSEDGSAYFVAVTNPNGVLLIDALGGLRGVTPCDCVPTSLALINRSPIYRITSASDGLFWILDGGTQARIVAVPPVPDAISPATANRGVNQ